MFFFYLNPILIAAAVIPAVVLLVKVYQADRLEKEPPRLLASLVLQGIFATVFAMLTEKLGIWILNRFWEPGTTVYNALLYFVVVAVSEEGFKYLLLKRRTWYSPDFNCQFDGVVYAVFVSLGFALWENIGYVMMYGLGTALIRAVTAVPGHACFGIFMGTWYGIAKRCEGECDYDRSKICRVLAFVIPAFLHGCYDYVAGFENIHGGWIFLVFILVMFFAAYRLVRKMSREDQFIERHHYW